MLQEGCNGVAVWRGARAAARRVRSVHSREAVTVYRFIAGIFAATLAVAGCSAVPGGTPLTSPLADAALEELCGTDDASLASIATELGQVDETTDTTALSTSLGTAISNLQGLTVDASAQVARDAALAALQQVQSALADPATRAQVAAQAAGAVQTLDTQLCG